MDGQAAALAREWGLGFEITEFCWAPRLEQPDAMALVRRQIEGARHLWLHAPFAELAPCAIDPLVRDAALHRFRQTVEANDITQADYPFSLVLNPAPGPSILETLLPDILLFGGPWPAESYLCPEGLQADSPWVCVRPWR